MYLVINPHSFVIGTCVFVLFACVFAQD